jgi:hypothetical protein
MNGDQFKFGFELVKTYKLSKIIKGASKAGNCKLLKIAYKKLDRERKKKLFLNSKFISGCKISNNEVFEFFKSKNVKNTLILKSICRAKNNYPFLESHLNQIVIPLDVTEHIILSLRAGNITIARFLIGDKSGEGARLGCSKLLKHDSISVYIFITALTTYFHGYNYLYEDIYHSDNEFLIKTEIPKTAYPCKFGYYMKHNNTAKIERYIEKYNIKIKRIYTVALRTKNESMIKKYIDYIPSSAYSSFSTRANKMIFDALKTRPSIEDIIQLIAGKPKHVRLYLSYYTTEELVKEAGKFSDYVRDRYFTDKSTKSFRYIFKACKYIKKHMLENINLLELRNHFKFDFIYMI